MSFRLPSLRPVLLLGLVCLLGFLSMGFQLVATRLLAPYFGSSIDVWAYLISTFLFSFSAGSMLGGWLCRTRGRQLKVAPLAVISAVALLGFAINTFAGVRILDLISARTESLHLSLFLSCAALFILPITSISAFSPLCAESLSVGGLTSGLASGLVYCVSTIGNIAGVMVTAFYLIPHFGISKLLIFWLAVSVVELPLLSLMLVIPLPRRVQHAPIPEEGAAHVHARIS